MTRQSRYSTLVLILGLILAASPASPNEAKPAPPGMSLDRMNALIEAIGDGVERMNSGQWRFSIENIPTLAGIHLIEHPSEQQELGRVNRRPGLGLLGKLIGRRPRFRPRPFLANRGAAGN